MIFDIAASWRDIDASIGDIPRKEDRLGNSGAAKPIDGIADQR